MIRSISRGWTQVVCWWLFVLVFLLCAPRGHSQQIPVVNRDGVQMYAPDRPFESINLRSCNGTGCPSTINEETYAGATVALRVNAAVAACGSLYTSTCNVLIPGYAPTGAGWATPPNNVVIRDERVNLGVGQYSSGSSPDPLPDLHDLHATIYHAGGNDASETIHLATASRILGWQISGNVATVSTTSPNSYISGESVLIAGLTAGSFLNSNLDLGTPYTVLSSGLSATQFQIAFTHADVPFTTDSGITGVACTFCGKSVDGVVAYADGGGTTNGSNASVGAIAGQVVRSYATPTATLTSGSKVVVVSSATNIFIGQTVIAANIPASTVVTGIAGTSITLSQAATANASSEASVFTSTRQVQAAVLGDQCYADGNPSHFCEAVELDTVNNGPDDTALATYGLNIVNGGSRSGVGVRIGHSSDFTHGWEYGATVNGYHVMGLQFASEDVGRISDLGFIPPADDNGMELQGLNAANNATVWKITDSGTASFPLVQTQQVQSTNAPLILDSDGTNYVQIKLDGVGKAAFLGTQFQLSGIPLTFNGDAGLSRLGAASIAIGNGAAGDFSGSVKATLYNGPATAPSGSCSVVGWEFTQDGHATFCNGTTWVSKI